ncbi:hypothetical protein FRB90_003538, partial [Tulasnella sp. 427]
MVKLRCLALPAARTSSTKASNKAPRARIDRPQPNGINLDQRQPQWIAATRPLYQ